MTKSLGRPSDEFGYLIDKIESAPFSDSPFRHLLIDDFLAPEHLDEITAAPQIDRPVAPRTEALIADLLDSGYAVQRFPGCRVSIEKYLEHYNADRWPSSDGLVEGKGLTFRLRRYETPLLQAFVDFLNSTGFKRALEAKFGIERPATAETAIQKYFHRYEISPHPDVRRKCLTYMLNINTCDEAERTPIHTHLLRFKPERRYVQEFWKHNPQADRCWVPWDWCESRVETRRNNSIVIFAPAHDTLHAVRLRYDHLKFQRTQAYGNLWYEDAPPAYTMNFRDLDLLAPRGSRTAPAPARKRGILRQVARRLTQ